MLVTTWVDDPYRPTRDLDLLGFGDSDPDAIIGAFREICALKADDAVAFDIDGLAIDRIRDEAQYGGLRIKNTATGGGATGGGRGGSWRGCAGGAGLTAV